MTAPALSVIVPAFRCAPALVRCLQALHASDLPRETWELIVADDGSPDDTPSIAAPLCDRVVRVAEGPCGPAAARNLGARHASGDVLVFVDADVCVAPDALRRFRDLFANSPEAAAFGSYDLSPTAPSFVSQYRNLLHHYVHATNAGPATTFWAGCGAVRASVFHAVGGFDAQRYQRPQIEDIELGYRIVEHGGAIRLDPAIQGTHLKRWTWRGGVVTDVRDRGVPWMRLLMARGQTTAAGPLNLRRGEQVLTVLVAAALPASVALGFYDWRAGVGASIVVLAGVSAANARLLRWFAEVRGAGFAARVAPLRVQYYILNASSAAWAMLTRHRRVPARGARATDWRSAPSPLR